MKLQIPNPQVVSFKCHCASDIFHVITFWEESSLVPGWPRIASSCHPFVYWKNFYYLLIYWIQLASWVSTPNRVTTSFITLLFFRQCFLALLVLQQVPENTENEAATYLVRLVSPWDALLFVSHLVTFYITQVLFWRLSVQHARSHSAAADSYSLIFPYFKPTHSNSWGLIVWLDGIVNTSEV